MHTHRPQIVLTAFTGSIRPFLKLQTSLMGLRVGILHFRCTVGLRAIHSPFRPYVAYSRRSKTADCCRQRWSRGLLIALSLPWTLNKYINQNTCANDSWYIDRRRSYNDSRAFCAWYCVCVDRIGWLVLQVSIKQNCERKLWTCWLMLCRLFFYSWQREEHKE